MSMADIQTQSLIEHAKRELKLSHEPDDIVAWYEKMLILCTKESPFSDIPNSQLRLLQRLLQRDVLSELTDNPKEWVRLNGNVWQNTRDPKSFSYDGGKTYHTLGDGPNDSTPSYYEAYEATNVD